MVRPRAFAVKEPASAPQTTFTLQAGAVGSPVAFRRPGIVDLVVTTADRHAGDVTIAGP
jgi:hypothetical protein